MCVKSLMKEGSNSEEFVPSTKFFGAAKLTFFTHKGITIPNSAIERC